MANTILTPTAVTREALRILHQKLNFVGNVVREYDSSFAKSGAKIGDSLKIRLPNQYTVRTGATLNTQDTTESSVTLQVATQKGVDINFSSAELTMDLDDFSDRILEPAMSVLGANIENDALSMYKDVHNEISDVGASMAFMDVMNANKVLTDELAPYSQRTLLLHTQANVDLVDALKGLYNDQTKVGKNYREGRVASNFAGFSDIYENTMMPTHTVGTDDGTGDYQVNDAGTIAEGSTSITVDTGAGTWKVGDIFSFDSVNRVHPETKADTGKLARFTITEAAAASATTIKFKPALYSSGAKQNVSAMPANNAKLNKLESDASTAVGNAADYQISMGFHKDAFAFATADLVMPNGVDFAAREVMDGISMRIVRDYDINNDKFPCRIDVLYGYKAIRPELACRIGVN
jgi:hypothetical protein|tara:strand:+ start:8113 stop:9333 length:1221 start_codon:yes stop_codon:yes gene_type:complete